MGNNDHLLRWIVHHVEIVSLHVSALLACLLQQVLGRQGGTVHPEEHEPHLCGARSRLCRRDRALRQPWCSSEGCSPQCSETGEMRQEMLLRTNSGSSSGEQNEEELFKPVEKSGKSVWLIF